VAGQEPTTSNPSDVIADHLDPYTKSVAFLRAPGRYLISILRTAHHENEIGDDVPEFAHREGDPRVLLQRGR
jgi:hypothetical protein